MPVIFASSLLAVPSALVRLSGVQALQDVSSQLAPGGSFYLPLTITFICVINYFYTFVQFDPNDIADNLKRGVRAPPLHCVMCFETLSNHQPMCKQI